jgi:hypothetical protein
VKERRERGIANSFLFELLDRCCVFNEIEEKGGIGIYFGRERNREKPLNILTLN